MKFLAVVVLVFCFLTLGDCGVVSSPPSPKQTPVSAKVAQVEGTTSTAAPPAVTEVPEEVTTIIEIEEPEGSNSSETMDFVNLPGYGVVDDANSTGNANSSFSCYNRRYGYYADIPKKCLMFHLCYPVLDQATGNLIFQRFSFVCSDDAVFDQQHLVCVDNDTLSYPCAESHQYYVTSNQKLIESMQQNAQVYAQNNPQEQGTAAGATVAESPAALSVEPVVESSEPQATNVTAESDAAAQYALLEQLFG